MAWVVKRFKKGTAVRITLKDGADWYGFFRRIETRPYGREHRQCLVFSATKDGASITTPVRIIHLVVEHDPAAKAVKKLRPQPKCVHFPRKSAA